MITMFGNSTATMRKHYRYLILALLGAAALCACDMHFKAGYFDEDKARALASVEKFRTLYEKHDYTGLYDLGSSAMKASISKDQFISAVQASMAQYGHISRLLSLGRHVSRTKCGWSMTPSTKRRTCRNS
jgi:hypothetical protein